jgi:hypothetical protein
MTRGIFFQINGPGTLLPALCTAPSSTPRLCSFVSGNVLGLAKVGLIKGTEANEL